MMIAARNAFLMGGAKPVEVEYLESTGTQYIDTGYRLSDFGVNSRISTLDSIWKMTASVTGATNIQGTYHGLILGVDASGNYFFSNNGVKASDGVTTIELKKQSGSWAIIFAEKGITIRNTTPWPIYAESDKILVCAAGNARAGATAVKPFYGRVYQASLEVNGTVFFNLVPVRVGLVGCMYDKRSVGGMNPDGTVRDDGLYFNRGSGAFVIGPDKWL